jgi:ABC-2 type transport system ATP-binding protein
MNLVDARESAPYGGEPAEAAVRVEELSKSFGHQEVLSGVSFEVGWGEAFGLVGTNGAGKSTLLRVLAGLSRPDAGVVEVAGVDATKEPVQLRRLVGYVPDHFGFYEPMTAAEYLAFFASCYRLPRRQAARAVDDLLALVGLSAEHDEQVDNLSRGMKQRLCLARALVHDPEVLLLDEPASGLDPKARAESFELLSALTEMGKTVVIASHILPELAAACSSFGVLHEGSVVAYGPGSQLLAGYPSLEELFLALTEPLSGQQGGQRDEEALAK